MVASGSVVGWRGRVERQKPIWIYHSYVLPTQQKKQNNKKEVSLQPIFKSHGRTLLGFEVKQVKIWIHKLTEDFICVP